jgi:acyl phosphate:glycerol-3-phosphate acyltransferase
VSAVLILLFAYLAGSIPFGLFIARTLTGKDVRSVGSGNIGATNVARAAGKGAAAATLVLDALKGLAPVLLARLVPDPFPFRSAAGLAAACAVLAVVGHCFPVWLRFRGGKGVATGLGVALALAPIAALCGAAAWLALYKLLRISSVGSLAGACVTLAVAGFTAPAVSVAGLGGVVVLILLRHKANLARLLRREERQL